MKGPGEVVIEKSQIIALFKPGLWKIKLDLDEFERRWLEMGYSKDEFQELVEYILENRVVKQLRPELKFLHRPRAKPS